MDIRKWLDETVLPEQPPALPEQLGLPPFLHPKATEQSHKGRRRKRAGSVSDSSLLDTRPRRQKTPPIEHEADIDDSACSDPSHPTDPSSGSSTSSQRYARRPRRKTRLERYEPTSKAVKERGTHIHRPPKGESTRTRRKSRRKKAEIPGTGIVQGFHAKNVPRDRLTLKPREKLGIFNKGRASSPVKGRGLPDLVFSEMKFLQKHKDQPETALQAGLPKKKRRKDHAHAREGEISAYFTSVRPALAEKDVNTQAKEGSRKKELVRDPDYGRERSSVIDNAMPTVELPDKTSYLRFGSRGPCHESESYISWSESIRATSATPTRPRAGSTINVGQLDSIHGRQDGRKTDGGEVSHSRAAPASVTRHITDGSGERFGVSSLAPANHRISRSHSYPRRTSSPPSVNLDNRAGKSRTIVTAASPSSMPPSIPHCTGSIRGRQRYTDVENAIESKSTSDPTEKPKLMRHARDFVVTESEEKVTDNVDARTSSTLGRILQECNSAFKERREAAASYEVNSLSMTQPARPSNEREPIHVESHGTAQRIPSVRFAGVEICRPMMSNFSGPSIYEEQERRQQYMQQAHANDHSLIQKPYPAEVEFLDGVEEEVDYDVQGWQGVPEETMSYELGVGTSLEGFAEPYEMEHVEQRLEQSEDVVARVFWRPHRLY